jgi:hypothetical protein
MTWAVAETTVPASNLKGVLEGLAAHGLEAQVHLAGPMGRDMQGRVLYEACYLVLSRVAGPGLEAATPPADHAPAPGPATEPQEPPPPDWLAELPPGLRDALAGAGIASVEALAGAWPDGVEAIEGLTLQDGRAIERLLEDWWSQNDSPPPPLPAHLQPAPRAAPRSPRPAPPPATSWTPPQSGLIVLPGMEGARIVPRGYTRPHAELAPELRDAAVLDGKPNVFHQPAIILPRQKLNGDRDGIEEP